MRILNQLFVAAALLAASFISTTLVASPITLENKVWNLLVVPGSPADNSVGELFGNRLDIADLFPLGNRTWAVYTFDRGTQNYVIATADTVLGDGEGFWVAQVTGEDMEIDMPDPSANNIGSTQDGCATSAGCFSVVLPTDASKTSWLMTGSPFNWSVAPADMRLTTNPPSCVATSCTLEKSNIVGYTGDSVFTYDSNTDDYQTMSGDDLIEPLSGFWLYVNSKANDKSPQLLIPNTAVTVQVSGIVSEPDGTVASGVSVEVDNTELAVTDALGAFSINLPSDASHVLQFVSDDHASQVRIVDLPLAGGQVNIEITLLKKTFVTTFDPLAEFTIVGPSGASVSSGFKSPYFVNKNGQGVGGPIEISITSVNVIDPAERRGFPGAFLGSPQDGNGELLPASTLISQGAVEFSFRDQNGEPLQLGGGKAQVRIPLFTDQHPNGSTIAEGDNIALWALNEETGIWEQEGSGEVQLSELSPTGLVLEAEVSHFSWWNCDVSPSTGKIRVGVFGPLTGTVNVIGSTSSDIGWRSASVSTVTTVGSFTAPLFVPANEPICVHADVVLDAGPSGTTSTACKSVAEDETKDIAFQFGVDIFVETASGLALEIKDDQGASAGQTFSVDGAVFSYIRPLSVSPRSLESSVTYTAQDLPPGMKLMEKIDGVSVSIIGEPTAGGTFNSVIRGEDSDGNQQSVSIQYTISPTINPPLLKSDGNGSIFSSEEIELFTSNGINSRKIFLSVFNFGGKASEWSISDIELVNLDNVPTEQSLPISLAVLPQGIELDTATGELTVKSPFGDSNDPLSPPGFDGLERITGTLRAVNVDENGQFQQDVSTIGITRGALDGIQE